METKIVNLDSIVPPTHQPRSSVGDISDLVTTISATYLFNSALVAKCRADGKLNLIIGERRYWAMKQAVKSHPDLPPYVSVIIYEPEELTADLEWMLALDENRVRKPLNPVDEARAVVELKLRVDCREMRGKLEGTIRWRDEELPQSLEAWQAEYERLAQLALTKGRTPESLLTATWADLEQQLHLKERDRRRMQQLATAPIATQDALRESDLGEHQQIAITYAPAERQIELIQVARQDGKRDDVSVNAIYAAAHALADERLQETPAAQVLAEAQRLYRMEPKQPPKELCQATINNLTRTAQEFESGDEDHSDDESEDTTDTDAAPEREGRILSPAEAQAFIDRELALIQNVTPSANGHAAVARPPTLARPQPAPISERDKLDSVLDTLDRAVDYLIAPHRHDEREHMIERLREMLERLEAANAA